MLIRLAQRYSDVNCFSGISLKSKRDQELRIHIFAESKTKIFLSQHAHSLVQNDLKFCKSPTITFRLYYLTTADDQWLGVLDTFTTTDIWMIPFLIIISISKNLLGSTSLVNLYSADNVLVSRKVDLVDSWALYYKYHQHNGCKISVLMV